MALGAELSAGQLQLRSGHGAGAIRSTRRDLAHALTRGRAADELPVLLGALFSLCGGVHRLASRQAVRAALDKGLAPSDEERLSLQAETLREHLRRLWLDWPQSFGAPEAAPSVQALADCPLMRHAGLDAAGVAWIEDHVLGLGASEWLSAWQAAPHDFAKRWAERGATAPARLLREAGRRVERLQMQPSPLLVHAATRELEHLAAALRHYGGFAMQPLWRGRTAETGTWTRLADARAAGEACPYGTVFMRLASRLVDVARLIAPEGALWLNQGALALAPFEGIAWCEMARGLLIHWVRLQPGSSADPAARVLDCHVIAPTDWNFHPLGVAARLLALLPPTAPAAELRALAAAFDPCVPVTIDAQHEVAHA